MSLARISVTLPPELVVAADRRAVELDRSRSWVVAEALRRYIEGAADERGALTVAETARSAYAVPGLDPQRRAQLEADLALTPEERVREAEATAKLGETGDRPRQLNRLLMFDSYEDYLAWGRWADLIPP
jgi:hypothetical protein